LIQLNDINFISNRTDLLQATFGRIDKLAWEKLFDAFDATVFLTVFDAIGQSENINFKAHLTEILAHFTEINKHIPFVMEQLAYFPNYMANVQVTKAKTKSSFDYYSSYDDKSEEVNQIVNNILIMSKLIEANGEWRASIITCLTKNINRDYVNEILVPTVLSDRYKDGLLCKDLRAATIENLQKRTETKPTPPENWTRAVPKNNKNWDILKDFLQSPTQKVFDYAANESYRSKLERTIKYETIDLSVKTIKVGRPHTLRITKTQAAYELDLKDWKTDMELLQSLM
jgi:hypothetical protein